MNKSIFWPDFNDLWDYSNPAHTEELFNQILTSPSLGKDPIYILQLQTQIARTYSLRGEFEQAHDILDTVEAGMQGEDIVEIRYLLERGRTFNSAGQPERAVPLFTQAATLSEQLGAEFYWVDALHMLGIAAPPAEQMNWNLKALHAAQKSSDEHARRWQGSLLNNIGWTYFDQDDYENALTTFEQTAAFYQDKPNHLNNYQIAQWSIAKTLRMLERPDEGLAILRELEAAEKLDGFTEEEIGECLLTLNQPADAAPYFQAAYEKLSKIAWVASDSDRINRLREYGAKGHDSY